MASEKIPHPTVVKVRDAISRVLRAAVKYGFLHKNPVEGLQLPPDKNVRGAKPTLTPEQFHHLIEFIAEPYATMLYAGVWTGLRVSELIGLRWRNIHADSISIEQRFCRGDWS